MKSETPKCRWCRWTNVGLWNIGDPGKPKWICQGCGKRLIESLSVAIKACKETRRALLMLKGTGDKSDWAAFKPLHQSLKLSEFAVAKSEGAEVACQ